MISCNYLTLSADPLKAGTLSATAIPSAHGAGAEHIFVKHEWTAIFQISMRKLRELRGLGSSGRVNSVWFQGPCSVPVWLKEAGQWTVTGLSLRQWQIASKCTIMQTYLHGAYFAMKRNVSWTENSVLREVLDSQPPSSSTPYWELITELWVTPACGRPEGGLASTRCPSLFLVPYPATSYEAPRLFLAPPSMHRKCPFVPQMKRILRCFWVFFGEILLFKAIKKNFFFFFFELSSLLEFSWGSQLQKAILAG